MNIDYYCNNNVKMRFFSIFLLISFLSFSQLRGQHKWQGHGLELGVHIGKIFKHSPKIIFPLDSLPITWGMDLAWEYRLSGNKYWHKPSGFPKMGVVLSFQNFGDERLGFGVGLMPYLSCRFFKKGPVEMFGRLAMGISYLSNYYDAWSNPLNNIIGSNINNNTAIRLGFAIQASPHLEIKPSFSFTHYSNGASQFPNLGINVMSFHLGFLLKSPRTDSIVLEKVAQIQRQKGLRYGFSFGLGMKEIGRTYRGPKYPVANFQFDMGMFTGKLNLVKIGLGYEHFFSDYFFAKHAGLSESQAQWSATRIMFYVEDEYLFGPLSLSAQAGYYFVNPPIALPFLRFGIKYYFKDPIFSSWSPYLGLRLKAHGITAEYFEFVLGFCLKKSYKPSL